MRVEGCWFVRLNYEVKGNQSVSLKIMSSGRQFEVSPYTHTVEFRVERCDIYCVEVQVHRVRSRVLVEGRLLAQAPSGLPCYMSAC